ncbi:hypothetical protein Mesau_00045 [Mesorhizobium australicum WSM2073]|uniref:Uncharacterized protein n=1 Tax=Mesorhizobium australicum (strain HAMBI 3006 / LMG 24608 / WSM2073) TaxID=754035 RepID=L0KC08_MESAW|nr:hypothetical protein Mesau_00045 [Mesorhizobium australicum WSM2073]
MQNALDAHVAALGGVENYTFLERDGPQTRPKLGTRCASAWRILYAATSSAKRRYKTVSGGRIFSMDVIADLLDVLHRGRRKTEGHYLWVPPLYFFSSRSKTLLA